MCQRACLPAPNTVNECTFVRLASKAVAARAVLKAVISSAARNAYGIPVLVSSVSEPRGVVLWEDATDVLRDGTLETDE